MNEIMSSLTSLQKEGKKTTGKEDITTSEVAR
jgi:hypothetical protein